MIETFLPQDGVLEAGLSVLFHPPPSDLATEFIEPFSQLYSDIVALFADLRRTFYVHCRVTEYDISGVST